LNMKTRASIASLGSNRVKTRSMMMPTEVKPVALKREEDIEDAKSSLNPVDNSNLKQEEETEKCDH
jgi:hypothetical protein